MDNKKFINITNYNYLTNSDYNTFGQIQCDISFKQFVGKTVFLRRFIATLYMSYVKHGYLSQKIALNSADVSDNIVNTTPSLRFHSNFSLSNQFA